MNKIRYINMCIVEFGKKFNMPTALSFNYLNQHGGLAFLDSCYEAEHQLSLTDALHDLTVICKRAGGTIE